MERLKGQTALVTGAGMGIGEGIAKHFAAEGARVLVADINEEAGRTVVGAIADAGGDAMFLKTDVRSEQAIAEAIAAVVGRWDRLDILVNNAAIALPDLDRLLTLEEQLWNDIIAINMRSVFFGMKHAIPVMQQAGGGSIVSIASIGALSGAGGTFAYGATKAAVMKMTMTAAARHAGEGLGHEAGDHALATGHAIAPGMILTPLSFKVSGAARREEAEAAFAKCQPLPRCGRPQDIAHAALFLAGPEAAFVTGQTLVVDGGLIMAGWGDAMARNTG